LRFESRLGLTRVRTTIVAIRSAVNRRQGGLRARFHVRLALAVSRVAVLLHNLDFCLQTEEWIVYRRVIPAERYTACVHSYLKSIQLPLRARKFSIYLSIYHTYIERKRFANNVVECFIRPL
jgi:hypothetical protein